MGRKKQDAKKGGFHNCAANDHGGVNVAPPVRCGGRKTHNPTTWHVNLWAALLSTGKSKPPSVKAKTTFRNRKASQREDILRDLLPSAHGGTAPWGTCSEAACMNKAENICFE